MNTADLHRLFLDSTGVCTDSRKLRDGEIFFALKGPNFNGNLFALQALESGAALAVIDEDTGAEDDRLILVDDALSALQDLARFHRTTLDIPVIGITGSNGKTTNKELIRAVLGTKFNVIATRGNLNNHIGVPLTVLEIGPECDIAIIEMGANHIGEIAQYCRIARPDHALITSIGIAHLEGFGSLEGVKQGKGELYEAVSASGGTCFVNLGLEHVPDLYPGPRENAVFFGDADHPPHILSVEQDDQLRVRFGLDDGQTLDIHSGLIGSFQAQNLLHALVAGLHFSVPAEDIAAALEGYVAKNNRTERREYRGNTVILDAYNANPPSMRAAIEAFLNRPEHPKMAILGDMFELGRDSKAYHQEIIDLVDNEAIDEVILVGKDFGQTVIPRHMHHFETTTEAKSWWDDQHVNGYHILIKGSRGVHLEVLVENGKKEA